MHPFISFSTTLSLWLSFLLSSSISLLFLSSSTDSFLDVLGLGRSNIEDDHPIMHRNWIRVVVDKVAIHEVVVANDNHKETTTGLLNMKLSASKTQIDINMSDTVFSLKCLLDISEMFFFIFIFISTSQLLEYEAVCCPDAHSHCWCEWSEIWNVHDQGMTACVTYFDVGLEKWSKIACKDPSL